MTTPSKASQRMVPADQPEVTRVDVQLADGERKDITEYAALEALEAVLAIHGPYEYNSYLICEECSDPSATDAVSYPCSTVQAIEAALEGR